MPRRRHLHSVLCAFAIVIVSCQSFTLNKEDRFYTTLPKMNRPLAISTILLEPYVMERRYRFNHSVALHYEGFIPELLNQLARLLRFRYTLHPVKDNRFGFRFPNGSWDGIVGQVVSKKVDFGAAPLMITAPRVRAVDFCTPILDVQATVLLRRDQGLHLTSAADLLNQTNIKYGIQKSGVIYRTFLKSNHSTYRTMWKRMKSIGPSVFTESNLAGIEKVRKGGYAYILSSTIGDYIAQKQPCDIRTLDRFLMNRYYSFAFPKCSNLLPAFNKAIDHLRRTEVIDDLYRRWWYQTGECSAAANYMALHHWMSVIIYSLSYLCS